MLRRVFLLSICLFVSQSVLFGQADQLPLYEDVEAYEVYSAVLSLPEVNALSKSKNFVIRHETITNFGTFLNTEPASSICLRPDAESEKTIGPVIRDFLKVNKMKRRLQAKFKLEIPYQLISFEKILFITKAEGWDGFYKKYPDSGGFIDLSAVGFNAEKTIAIVSQGRWCGDLCGAGRYYVLQKKDGKWIPLSWNGELCDWTS